MLDWFIIVNEQPFFLVEHVIFHEFVIELQPLFKHISCFIVTRDCMKLYFYKRTCLKTYFYKLNFRIALMTNT